MSNWINQWGNTYLIAATTADLPTVSNFIGQLAVVTASSSLYEWNGSSWSMIASPGGTPSAITSLSGDVSSSGPGASAATVLAVGGSSAANINSATQLVLNSEAANKVFASPASGSGVPAFRSLVASDLPVLNQNTTGTASAITGNLSGDVTSVGMVTTIPAASIANAKLAQMPALSLKGNSSLGSAVPSDVSIATVTSVLNQFSSSAQGVVPASGGGTSNYLRADGTWSALPSSYSRAITSISTSQTLPTTPNVDQYFFVSGITTVTLPTAMGNTSLYCVKNVGSGTVTINTSAGQTVDGQTSISVAVKYTSITFLSDGSNWNVV